MKIVDCDYFVVGSGMAGLMTALHLASYGKVVVATKERLQDCNSNFAQGGICCVMDPDDTFDKHARDTMIAGAWLGKSEVVHEICEHAPEGIQDLIACGVKFAKKEDGSWDLTREGGHSARRIFHAGDITGEKCEAAMIRKIKKSGVELLERTIVIDLIMSRRIGLKGENRCLGAYVLDKKTSEIYAVRSSNTVLATGGCGKVYLYTDLFIIASVLLVPGKTVQDMLYGYITMVTFTLMLDFFMMGRTSSVQVMIFSEKTSEIADYIVHQLDRGVTAIKSVGWYSKKDRDVLLVVTRKYRLSALTKAIKQIDRKAFVTITPTSSVYGEGFEEIKTGIERKKLKVSNTDE